MKQLIAAVCLAGSLAAGAETALPPAADRAVDYRTDIFPIFDTHCIDCHGEVRPKAGFRMDTAEGMMKGGAEGVAIVPGNSAESLLVLLLVGAHPDFDRMPPKGDPLSNDEIALVRAWIDQGAKMPADADGAPAAEAPKGDYPASATVPGVAGWKVEATDQQGALATWARSESLKGPNGEAVVAMTEANSDHAGTFNLCWTAEPAVRDGEFATKLKATGGEVDQGGGIAWRIQDKDNYYVARYNPLKGDVRAYKVVGGKHTLLAEAALENPGGWIALGVAHRGGAFTVTVNGAELLKGDDAEFAGPGGYGYWTKADATTAFTSITVTQP